MPSPNERASNWIGDLIGGLLDSVDLIEVFAWVIRAVCHVIHALLTCHF